MPVEPSLIVHKARVYVPSPTDAPEGVTLEVGPRGGLYYERDEPSVAPHDERAFEGIQRDVSVPISKQEAGELGESIVLAYLRSQGLDDAKPLNSRKANFPVDLVQDHGVVEVKTGLVSNSKSAQQWRATIGQPGKAESAWLKTASRDEKRAWNEQKNADILARKQRALSEIEAEVGMPMHAKTMTVILNPDERTADLYEFDGFHLRIGWNTPEAKSGYLGTYRYG